MRYSTRKSSAAPLAVIVRRAPSPRSLLVGALVCGALLLLCQRLPFAAVPDAQQPHPAIPPDAGSATAPLESIKARFAGTLKPPPPLDQICAMRSGRFPQVVLLGIELGHSDLDQPFGCEAQALLIDGSFVPIKAAAAVLLGRQGFRQLASRERLAIALDWTRQLYLGFEGVLDAPSSAFHRRRAPRFAAPRANVLQNGNIEITAYTQPPFPGPYDVLRRWRLLFAPDGSLLEARRIQQLVFDWHSDPEFRHSDGNAAAAGIP